MKKLVTFISLMLVVAMLFTFTACGEKDPCKDGHEYVDGTCTVCGEADPDYVAPVPKVEYNEETAVDFIFEAEYATIVGDALKHSYFEYQGNGHIVDGTPSMEVEGGLMALPSNNGLFVGYMGASAGDKIEWVITSEVECDALLSISMSGNYAGAGDPDLMAVSVNGVNIEFEKQGSCLSRAFSEGIAVVVSLVKGDNVIVLTSKDEFKTTNDYWDGVNCCRFLDVDYMKLSACVDESNFTFKNETAINADAAHQMNPNGKITKYNPTWYQPGVE